MQLHLTPSDGLPIYRQVVNQVKYLVAAGRLASGEELPAIRTLAEQLVVNPNTIARAYLELERAGIVTKRHGSGTYVTDGSSPLKRGERLRLLTQRADALLAEARHLQIELDDVVALLRQRAELLEPEEQK